jgi:hypothetical protein
MTVEIQSRLRSLIGEPLTTMRGRPFRVLSVSDRTVMYEVGGNRRPGQLMVYEQVLERLRAGDRVTSPKGIQDIVPGTHNSAYEWAVLRRLGLVKE